MLKVGDKLPDIKLKNQNNEDVDLHDFIGKKPLVIYFYPKDNTRVCTAQACGFRDHYEDFTSLGAEVIGISRDSVDSHKKVANKRQLPFVLLSDQKKIALKAFGVPSMLFGLVPGRVTFVVNKEGEIIHTFTSNFTADDHIEVALNKLKDI